jgi:hypothetical protein
MCSTGLNVEVHDRVIEDMVGDVMVFRTCNGYILRRVEEVMEQRILSTVNVS